MIIEFLRQWKRKLRLTRKPIFILGNQKSGTSIIVELVGDASKKSFVNDIDKIYEPIQYKLYTKVLPFKNFIESIAYQEFSAEIIKEPSLTLFYKELIKLYPKSKYVFIIRDPRDNIRSILDRVKLSGNKNISLDDISASDLTIEWKKILDNRWLGYVGNDCIESLAYRWNLFAKIYNDNRENMILVRYEDFLADKAKYIDRLCSRLEIKYSDISNKVDIQYQPKGNSSVNLEDFFGIENLNKIKNMCYDNAVIFDYKIN